MTYYPIHAIAVEMKDNDVYFFCFETNIFSLFILLYYELLKIKATEA
jgi:hypothetical protein